MGCTDVYLQTSAFTQLVLYYQQEQDIRAYHKKTELNWLKTLRASSGILEPLADTAGASVNHLQTAAEGPGAANLTQWLVWCSFPTILIMLGIIF